MDLPATGERPPHCRFCQQRFRLFSSFNAWRLFRAVATAAGNSSAGAPAGTGAAATAAGAAGAGATAAAASASPDGRRREQEQQQSLLAGVGSLEEVIPTLSRLIETEDGIGGGSISGPDRRASGASAASTHGSRLERDLTSSGVANDSSRGQGNEPALVSSPATNAGNGPHGAGNSDRSGGGGGDDGLIRNNANPATAYVGQATDRRMAGYKRTTTSPTISAAGDGAQAVVGVAAVGTVCLLGGGSGLLWQAIVVPLLWMGAMVAGVGLAAAAAHWVEGTGFWLGKGR